MNKRTLISTSTAAAAAMSAGVTVAAGGIIQITDSASGESTVVGIEHVGLATLTGLLLLLIPVVLYLGRLAGRPRAAIVSSVAMTALAGLTVVSNVRGEDPSFFAAVAAPSNALILGGLVTLAVSLRRNGVLPRAMAIGLGLVWIFTLPLSNLGGMVVAGAFWFALGWMIKHDELPRPAIATA